jgi:hypothetical protein
MFRHLLTVVFVAMPLSAQALSMKECGEQYRAAQKAGSLGGKGWNAFRAQNCAAATSAPSAAALDTPPAESMQTTDAKVAATPAGSGPVLPAAVSPGYAQESPSKARRLTCLEQYRANKKTGGNGSLKWIQKGGGYYSLCSKHLRG